MKNKKSEKDMLDKIDLSIISFINKYNKINLSKIAENLGMSHVAIGTRLNNMIKKKLIKLGIKINPKLLKLNLGLILLEVETNRYKDLIKIYENCPRVLYFFDLVGEYNLGVIFYAENIDTYHTILKFCMLYSLKGIRKSTILTIGKFYPPNYINIDTSKFKLNNIPCGISCNNCEAFKNNLCVGCPNFSLYKGFVKFSFIDI